MTDKKQKIIKSEGKSSRSEKKAGGENRLLTIVLTVFLIQTVVGAVVGIGKTIAINNKISKTVKLHKAAEKRNAELRYKTDSFHTEKSLESIARSALKMSGPNEALVLVNELKPDSDKPSLR